MQHFDIAQVGLGQSLLWDSSLLVLVTGFFFFVVLGYFLSSGFFQSDRRKGRFKGDGVALLLSGGLFLAFAIGYMEIFLVAFRLPFSAYQDLAIGLGSVSVAGLAAFAVAKFVKSRPAKTATANVPDKA